MLGRKLFQLFHVTLTSVCVIGVTGCACSDQRHLESHHNQEVAQAAPPIYGQKAITKAVAYLSPIKGSKVKGKVVFKKVANGVQIIANIDGLSPGKHGFHIHEQSGCQEKEDAAVGAHFNPTNQPHAGPDSPMRHIGDLGNLIADDNGHAHYERIDRLIALEGKNSIVGQVLIVHAEADDYTSQPAGASGIGISCGLIQAE